MSNKFPTDENIFIDMEQELLKENEKELVKSIEKGILEDKDLLEKIDKRAKKENKEIETVIAEIKTNRSVRREMTKNPSRQNMSEKAIEKYLKEQNMGDVKKLPSSGHNVMFVVQGNVLKNPTTKPTTKSIDFHIKQEDGYDIYIYHKYTNEHGGHQDNQARDGEEWIKSCRNSNEDNTLFILCIDGAYYDDKIDRLKSEYQSEHNKCIVCRYYEMVEEIKKKKKLLSK